MLGALLFNDKVLRYAKFAAGLRGEDVRDLDAKGIPVWLVVVASLLVGAYAGVRFTPKPVTRWVRGEKSGD